MKTIALVFSCLIIAVASQADDQQRAESFDQVWDTINERFYDADFNGVDWPAMRDKYRDEAINAEDDDAFYDAVNYMLFELGVSHLGVIPPDDPSLIGSPQLTMEGGVGLDLRMSEARAYIIYVEPGSPAALAGLKAGYEILGVDTASVAEVISERTKDPTPPFNDRNLSAMITQDIHKYCFGEPGDSVAIRYRDNDSTEHEAMLIFARREGAVFLMPDIPPIFASADKRLLEDDIGYIRFDVFHPAILDSLLDAIRSLSETHAMIIDIRGNPGGDFQTRKRLAEQFVTERTLFWSYRTRVGTREVYLDPAPDAYTGQLVVLVDYMSTSSSEEFSGAMQAIDRATIIGQQTPGKVLVMEVMQLANGGIFVFPTEETRTQDGTVLEGRGVIPDIEVELDLSALRDGRDSQLEAAVKFLTE
jgi:carboxyl-terminal processing protease